MFQGSVFHFMTYETLNNVHLLRRQTCYSCQMLRMNSILFIALVTLLLSLKADSPQMTSALFQYLIYVAMYKLFTVAYSEYSTFTLVG